MSRGMPLGVANMNTCIGSLLVMVCACVPYSRRGGGKDLYKHKDYHNHRHQRQAESCQLGEWAFSFPYTLGMGNVRKIWGKQKIVMDRCTINNCIVQRVMHTTTCSKKKRNGARAPVAFLAVAVCVRAGMSMDGGMQCPLFFSRAWSY